MLKLVNNRNMYPGSFIKDDTVCKNFLIIFNPLLPPFHPLDKSLCGTFSNTDSSEGIYGGLKTIKSNTGTFFRHEKIEKRSEFK
jgi:hypothetical protein